MMSDLASSVDEVESRPVLVFECVPDRVVAVDRDRIIDAHVQHGFPDIVDVLLELEFGCVHANHDQSAALILLGPRTQVREGAAPVDAGIRPEIDDHDLATQRLDGQRRRVQPLGCAGERWKRGCEDWRYLLFGHDFVLATGPWPGLECVASRAGHSRAEGGAE
ncbi:MAG TPA: hypothetical protein VK524_06775 [Polyangiaceae bacterium]|nr:hypothetical protein [Polyangiaceae bacterium]